MFLDIFKNNNTKYIRISESYRDKNKDGKSVARKKTVKNIGPVSKYDDGKPDFIERLKASFKAGTPIIKELEPFVDKNINKEIYNLQIHQGTDECVGHPKLYSHMLLEKIMQDIGLIDYISKYKTHYKLSYDVLGFFRLLIYGRILKPASKMATVKQNENYYNNIISKEAYEYNVYDTLDFIYDNKKAFFNRIDNNLRLNYGRTTNIIYYDVTNFFFYSESPAYEYDEDGNKTVTGLPVYGVSKENQKLPIVQMGLLMDEQSIPISIEAFPGNTLDHLTLQQSFNNSVDYIKNKHNRYIFVSDKGIGKGDNPKFSISNGNGYIVSKSVRGCTKADRKWILSDDDYVLNTEKFKIKSKIYTKKYTLENKETLKSSEKMVSYWSEKFYNKQYHEQKNFYDTLRELLKCPESFPSNRLQDSKFSKYLTKSLVNKKTGEVIKKSELDELINIEKVREDLELLGWYSIVTSETNMTENEIIDTYGNLVQIEDQFRVMKSTLDTRPLFVSTDKHIIAHLSMCTFALIVLRMIQKQVSKVCGVSLSPNRIQEALLKWTVEKLADEYYRFNNIDDPDLLLILKAFDVQIEKKLYKLQDLRNLKSSMKTKA